MVYYLPVVEVEYAAGPVNEKEDQIIYYDAQEHVEIKYLYSNTVNSKQKKWQRKNIISLKEPVYP